MVWQALYQENRTHYIYDWNCASESTIQMVRKKIMKI